MTEEEAAEMDEAKSHELAEWIQEEGVSKVREGQEVPQTILMSMRWVLTWKPSGEHPPGGKAKARMVVLGHQHPEVAERTVANSTLSRLGKTLALQWTAFNHAELERADAMSAMLQGDGQEMQESEDVYARALNELACAMNTPLGSAVKLAKDVFKLGNAPQSWRLSVDRFLTSMAGRRRGRRTRTDPTVWCLSPKGLGTTCALVAACVGKLFITGIAGKMFEQLKSRLRECFCWVSWKFRVLVCAVCEFTKKVDHMSVRDQTSYVNSGNNHINVDTHRDFDRSLTSAQITSLRGVWRAIQWKVTLTGPQHAATLSDFHHADILLSGPETRGRQETEERCGSDRGRRKSGQCSGRAGNLGDRIDDEDP